jgi:hypothetical protein
MIAAGLALQLSQTGRNCGPFFFMRPAHVALQR